MRRRIHVSYKEEDTGVSYEEEDTCVSHEEWAYYLLIYIYHVYSIKALYYYLI
jgi:hypothetical protein